VVDATTSLQHRLSSLENLLDLLENGVWVPWFLCSVCRLRDFAFVTLSPAFLTLNENETNCHRAEEIEVGDNDQT
jgi:hypothetical protein